MPPPRIVVAGGTGFLGRALSAALVCDGYQLVVLTRSSTSAQGGTGSPPRDGIPRAHWTPDGTSGPWAQVLDGATAVVNLAGESIAAGRWSPARKARLHDSRLKATASLVAALDACDNPPAVFVSASAVGYYGCRENEALTETSPPGSDFLARLCVEWEEEAARAAARVGRVVVVRSALVLDAHQGALPRMLAPFRFFVGGPVGSGQQYVSWIHRDDWVALVSWAIKTPSLAGPVNASSPEPVRNEAFAKIAARVLGRPAIMRAPAFAVRALFGEMGETLALGGQRVMPTRALAFGFRFRYPALGEALQAIRSE